MEETGVFFLKRHDPIEVLAATIPSSQYNNPEVKEAMIEELTKWKTFGAYDLVEDIGQECLDGRWVVTKKQDHDGLKVNMKARFCIRGFKELDKPRTTVQLWTDSQQK